jgi:ubiquinone/menaquinone biosynthesis C-methylase UbiE
MMIALENPFNHRDFLQEYMRIRDNPAGQNALLDFPTMVSLFPSVTGAAVLDLGCGSGDLCRHAVERGASSAIGVDISQEMVNLARKRTTNPKVTYITADILDFEYGDRSFDLIVSSLTLHYVERYDMVLGQVRHFLRPGGLFLFSVEHPIYTAPRTGWNRALDGARDAATPLDYGCEGLRVVPWLGYQVPKYHRKLETYITGLLALGFVVKAVREPQPDAAQLELYPVLQYEALTPPFLVVAASV